LLEMSLMMKFRLTADLPEFRPVKHRLARQLVVCSKLFVLVTM